MTSNHFLRHDPIIGLISQSGIPTFIDKKKNSANFSNFSLKFFDPKLGEKNFLLSKVGMGNKLYFFNFFHLLLKKFRPFSDFTFEREVS